MQDRPENLAFQNAHAIDLVDGGRHVGSGAAVVRQTDVNQFAGFALHAKLVRLQVILRGLIDDGTEVRGVIEGIADIERVDRTCQHAQGVIGDFVLDEEDTGGGATLACAVEG